MSHVKTMYLTSVGQYRVRWGKLTALWPKFLINGPDKMAHSLEGSPTVPKTTPVRFTDWKSFVEEPPPHPPVNIDELRMLCQENSIWPVSCQPDTVKDTGYLLKQTSMMHQEALQNVKATLWRERYGNPLLNWAFALTIVAGAVFVLMIVAIIAQMKFG